MQPRLRTSRAWVWNRGGAVISRKRFKSGVRTRYAISLVAVFLFLALVIPALLQALYVYPTPETQSAFLKAYDPYPVIDRFRSKTCNSELSGTAGSGAGWGFANHEKAFEPRIFIASDDWVPLMSALAADISSKLALDDVQIVNQAGNVSEGFRFDYEVGKTVGTVTLEPPKRIENSSISCDSGTPRKEMHVDLRISTKEKWYRTKSGLQSAQNAIRF